MDVADLDVRVSDGGCDLPGVVSDISERRVRSGSGLVKARNFRQSDRKSAYAYLLTPRGIEEKIQVTYAFLRRKLDEHDALAAEIERLSAEVREIEAVGEAEK